MFETIQEGMGDPDEVRNLSANCLNNIESVMRQNIDFYCYIFAGQTCDCVREWQAACGLFPRGDQGESRAGNRQAESKQGCSKRARVVLLFLSFYQVLSAFQMNAVQICCILYLL